MIDFNQAKRAAKAILLVAALIAAPISIAHADNDIGCGVGTNAFEGESSAWKKILAYWINGMTMQSISVSFGLVGCGELGDTITASAATRHFAAVHLDGLARDAATGSGERLDALASLLTVDDTQAFGQFVQTNYDVLFPAADASADAMLSSLDVLMRADARFAAFAPSAQI